MRELVLHAQQLLALALQHLVDRHAGPARDDLRDVVGRHRLFHHAPRARRPRLDLGELLLELRDHAVGELAGALVVAAGAAPGRARCGPGRAAS